MLTTNRRIQMKPVRISTRDQALKNTGSTLGIGDDNPVQEKKRTGKGKVNTTEPVNQTEMETTGSSEPVKEAKAEKEKTPEQNGVRRPKSTTKCGKIWDAFDAASKRLVRPTSLGEAEKELKENLSSFTDDTEATLKTVQTQYFYWKKFNGLQGVKIVDPAKEQQEAEKAKLKEQADLEKARLKEAAKIAAGEAAEAKAKEDVEAKKAAAEAANQ